MSGRDANQLPPERCGKEFTGTIMVPIPAPAYGWEPLTESDVCTRPAGHDGWCSGANLIDPELPEAEDA